jgi:transcriptional regulator with XRE-family HTH domain
LCITVASSRGVGKLPDMTTLMVVDGRADETRTEAIARRLRGELGQLNLSISEVARRTGLSQPALSRRMTGQIAFDIEELDLICTTLGISFDYVTTGARVIPVMPPDPPSGPRQRSQGPIKKGGRRSNSPVGEFSDRDLAA